MAIDGAGVWRESGRRTRFLRVGFLAVMALIAVRLVIIQGLQHDYYLQRYEEVARQSIELHARRGTVTDRVGRELAVDRPAIAVYVHPDRLQDVRGTSERLGAILGMDPEEIRQRILDCPDPFMYVDRQVDASLKPRIVEITRLEPKGVGTEPATRRVYPKGALAADLLGFTGIEHTGLAGLEATFEPRLHGKAGLAVGERDVTGWPIPHRTTTMAPAKDGSSLKLTLDVKVQQACERELAMGIQEVGAESGCVVVMDVATGDVLAACDYPTFDPNSWQEVDPEVWSPRFSTWIYEPGSTIKPLVVAMALSEGVISPSSTFYCGGTLEAGDWEVRCGHVDGGHGTVDLTNLLKYSCNVGAAQMGQAAGAEELTRLFERLGFTDLPTRELPAQCHPLPPYKGPAWCATASFGQGIGITPLHLAAAYGALANGGVMMRPRFVDSAIDAEGHAKEFPPVEVTRVYPRHAARRVVSMLGHVVQDADGTGHRARVPGCTVAGKTGTAEVVVDGKYEPGQYVVSFVGLLPAEDPRYVIVVVLDRPEGDAYGGTMAAPVFRDIAESLITDLHLPVQRPVAAFEPGEETP